MPGADPITAIANAVAEITHATKPLLDAAIARRLRDAEVKTVCTWAEACAAGDSDRMHSLVDCLLAEAGQPVGAPSSRRIEFDLAYLDQLVRVAARGIHFERAANEFILALKQQ